MDPGNRIEAATPGYCQLLVKPNNGPAQLKIG